MAMSSDYSLSDIAAATGKNNQGGDGMFGGNCVLWIIVLFLFVSLGWGGMGNRAGASGSDGGAMAGYVLTSDFATIERKLDSVNNGLCDGFFAMAQQMNGAQAATAQGFATAELSRANQQAALMQQLYAMSTAQQECCCRTQQQIERGFADTNYNLATQGCETRNTIQVAARDIIENANGNARAILDALTQQRIEAKDEKIAAQNQQIFDLKMNVNQDARYNQLVNLLRPCPIPSYSVPNPFCCQPQPCTC